MCDGIKCTFRIYLLLKVEGRLHPSAEIVNIDFQLAGFGNCTPEDTAVKGSHEPLPYWASLKTFRCLQTTAVQRVANMKNVAVIHYNNIIFKFFRFYNSTAHIFPLQSLLSFISIMWVSLAKATHTKNGCKKVICYPLGFIFFSPRKQKYLNLVSVCIIPLTWTL